MRADRGVYLLPSDGDRASLLFELHNIAVTAKRTDGSNLELARRKRFRIDVSPEKISRCERRTLANVRECSFEQERVETVELLPLLRHKHHRAQLLRARKNSIFEMFTEFESKLSRERLILNVRSWRRGGPRCPLGLRCSSGEGGRLNDNFRFDVLRARETCP